MPEKQDSDQKEKKSKTKKTVSKITAKNLISKILDGYGKDSTDEGKTVAKKMMCDYLTQNAEEYKLSTKYNILVLFDSSIMVKGDADNVYNAVTSFSEKKPLLMVLYSTGGNIGSAYLIGQLCREYSKESFIITVPRDAKSAATLLCCSADEIHMGSLSELGPIDPQINNLPALGLKNSIQHIANLVKETPESAEMFAKYLHYSLNPIDLGYYERVAESALQYAERLLNTHSINLPRPASVIANELVYTYKDHGFVIDKNEAKNIFGDNIIQVNTAEYDMGNKLYKDLRLIESVANFLNYNFYMIGSLDSEPMLRKK